MKRYELRPEQWWKVQAIIHGKEGNQARKGVDLRFVSSHPIGVDITASIILRLPTRD